MVAKVIGFCVKCKAKREIQNPKLRILKGKGGTKRKAVTGTCPECGTKMFKFVPEDYEL